MTDRASLFARKLRAHRAAAGRQGRLTQEDLAALLDVSVEAVSKYERSQSYIRGDLEPRLIERLGWSAADVAACRTDWDAHHLRPRQGGYRLMDEAAFQRVYGGDWGAVFREMMRHLDDEVPDLSDDFAGDAERWVPIISRFPAHGAVVLQGDAFVGHWGLVFLAGQEAERMRGRLLLESELSAERLRRPVLPGRYYAYCPIVVIAKGHEAAAPLMLSSFQAFLEDLAVREVVLDSIAATTVSPDGRQFCEDLGFAHLGPHLEAPDYDVWELSGAAIAGSILGRRSAVVREAYGAAFAAGA